MNRKVFLAGTLGALAFFVWTFLAHMALPLGEAGVSQIPNEAPILSALQAANLPHALYIFPGMAPGTSEADYGKKIESGPSGMLIYYPQRDFNFGAALALEFLTQWIQVMIAAYLLSLTRISTFGGRLGFFALIGLAAVISTNLSYANWYGFPAFYSLSYAFTVWVGYLCAGLVAAKLKVGGSAA